MHTTRIAFSEVPEGIIKSMMAIEKYLATTGLEVLLLELLRLRASQINGCSYCIDMHYKEALAAGDVALRLYSLSAWRETPYYNERERVALAFTEALTNVSKDGVSDALYQAVAKVFTQEEIANLTMAVAQINSWNRLVASFRFTPGQYTAGSH